MGKRSGSGITSGGGSGRGTGSSSSGSGSSASAVSQSTLPQSAAAAVPQPQQAPQPQNVAPTPTGSSFDALRKMDDDQLADIAIKSKTVDMPNMLADVDDVTQKFVYQANLNDKPQVLDQADFNKFMSDNNLGKSDLLSRSINDISYTNKSGTHVPMKAQDVADMMMYSKYNYIGGKVNGQALGAGTYFDHTNGNPTGYGKKTVVAVLNPATARTIDSYTLRQKASSFAKTQPKFAKAVGSYNTAFSGGKNNMAIYALAMGYNVIMDSGGYTNVIDRSALVYRK